MKEINYYRKLKGYLEEYIKELEIIACLCIVYSGISKYIEDSKNPAIDCCHPAARPFIENIRKNFGSYSGLKECDSEIHTIVEHSKRMRDASLKIGQILEEDTSLLNEGEKKILAERLICTEGCKYFTDLLDKKFEILDKLMKKIQNHLDNEL